MEIYLKWKETRYFFHSCKGFAKYLKDPKFGSFFRFLQIFSSRKRVKCWYKPVCVLQHINILIFSRGEKKGKPYCEGTVNVLRTTWNANLAFFTSKTSLTFINSHDGKIEAVKNTWFTSVVYNSQWHLVGGVVN